MKTTAKTLTVNAFAEAAGHDRRTVQRRISANGIRPVAKLGRYDCYSVEALEDLMRDDDGPRSDRESPAEQSRESARDSAIYAIGEALPGLIDGIAKELGATPGRRLLDDLTYRLWRALTERIESDQEQTVSGSMLAFIDRETIFELPEALQLIAFRLGIKDIPPGFCPNWLTRLQPPLETIVSNHDQPTTT